ncbi:unnamed protein product, partial [Rotaria sordida]
SSPITEEVQYEPSSTFAAVPIAFHQQIHEVKHEPEEQYQIEQKLGTKSVIVESPEVSEHEQEEEEEEEEEVEQYEPESVTSSDKIHIESTEITEQDRYEPLLTSEQEFIETPELRTSYTEEKEDHYESEEELTTDEFLFR